MVIERFGVYRIALDSTVGRKMSKTRPCVLMSPDEMNRHIRTVIIAPMTTTRKRYPTRIACTLGGKQGEVVLDQIRTVDQSRLTRRLGQLDRSTAAKVLRVLQEMFA